MIRKIVLTSVIGLLLTSCAGTSSPAAEERYETLAEEPAVEPYEDDVEFVDRCLDEFYPLLSDVLRLDGFFNNTVMLTAVGNGFEAGGRSELSSGEMINYLRPRMNYTLWPNARDEAEQILNSTMGINFPNLDDLSELDQQLAAETAREEYEAAGVRIASELRSASPDRAALLSDFQGMSSWLLVLFEGRGYEWVTALDALRRSTFNLRGQGPFSQVSDSQFDVLDELLIPISQSFDDQYTEFYEDLIADTLSMLGTSVGSEYVIEIASFYGDMFKRDLSRAPGDLGELTIDGVNELTFALSAAVGDPNLARGRLATLLTNDYGPQDFSWFYLPEDPDAPWNINQAFCYR